MLVNVVGGLWSGFRVIVLKTVFVVQMPDHVFLNVFMKFEFRFGDLSMVKRKRFQFSWSV